MKKFVNCIPDEFFYLDPNGLHRLKDTKIVYEKLREMSAGGFQWKHQNSGYTPDGRPYFVGELTVYDDEGTAVTVVGSAEAASSNLTMPGVTTLALENACLRGLGMGERYYLDREEKHVVGTQVPESNQTGFTHPEIDHPFQTRPNHSNNNTAVITFGQKYKGRAYSSMITQAEVEWLRWAATKDKPDRGAVQELKSRGLL